MSPQIIAEKLAHLTEVLHDLKLFVDADRGRLEAHHYAVERMVQLASDLSLSLARRRIASDGRAPPSTARDTYLALAESGAISKKLAEKMALASGLRNLLVHEYGKIDFDRFFGGLPEGFKTFSAFARSAGKWLKPRKK